MAQGLPRTRRTSVAGMFAAALVVVAACTGDPVSPPPPPPSGPPPGIALALEGSSVSTAQGTTVFVGATLTRSGGFSGTVTLSVLGVPAGVTGSISNSQTSGTTTTALVTILVAPNTTPGTYPLTVRGQGSGVSDATAAFTLTVTAAGSFTLGVTPGAVTLQQGAQDASKTVTINRTNYPANITLTAEGLPNGVTALFAGNPVSGSSSVLTLTASAGAAVGGPVLVTIRGTGPSSLLGTGVEVGLEATVTLLVTVTAAPGVSLSVAPGGDLTVPQGGSDNSRTVTLHRTSFPGNVTLTAEGLPSGATATFAGNPVSGNSSVMTVTVDAGTAPGLTTIVIRGRAAGIADATTSFQLLVTAAGSFTLSLVPAGGLSLLQGTSDNSKTVSITRSNYLPGITLTAEGLPNGVSAAFAGNPVSGSSSVMTLTATSGATLGGPVTVTVRGSGPAAVRAEGEPAALDATTTFQLTVVAPQPAGVSASNSTIAVSPGAIVASTGAQTATITVTLKDAGGNLLSGRPVMVTVSGLDPHVQALQATTDANGQAIFTYYSSKANPANVVQAVGDGVTLNASPTISVQPAPASSVVLTVNKVTTQADNPGGSGAVALEVTVTDAFGNPISNAAVDFTLSTGAVLVFTPATGNTGSNGKYSATSFSSTAAGAKSLKARVSSIASNAVAVTVQPGPINRTFSTVASQYGGVPVTVANELTVTVVDDFGNPRQGDAVSLTLNPQTGHAHADIPDPSAGATAANGEYKRTVTPFDDPFNHFDTLTVVATVAGQPLAAPAKFAVEGGVASLTLLDCITGLPTNNLSLPTYGATRDVQLKALDGGGNELSFEARPVVVDPGTGLVFDIVRMSDPTCGAAIRQASLRYPGPLANDLSRRRTRDRVRITGRGQGFDTGSITVDNTSEQISATGSDTRPKHLVFNPLEPLQIPLNNGSLGLTVRMVLDADGSLLQGRWGETSLIPTDGLANVGSESPTNNGFTTSITGVSAGGLFFNATVHQTSQTVFGVVSGPTIPWAAVDAGLDFACGIAQVTGFLHCWGTFPGSATPQEAPLQIGTQAFREPMAVGSSHVCATAVSDGKLYCWGDNFFGQLGINNKTNQLGAPALVNGGHTFTAVAAAAVHTCGIRTDGRVLCWGSSFAGQLGNNTFSESLVPTTVSDTRTYRDLTAGGYHTCGITSAPVADQLFCWGQNVQGQVGDATGQNRSVPTSVGLAYASVSAGAYHTCAIATGGQGKCWGQNADGQLGVTSPTGHQLFPVNVTGGSNLSGVAAGSTHTCFRTTAQVLRCTGKNDKGQFGNGLSTSPFGSLQSSGANQTFTRIVTGSDFTCALRNADLYCWGANTVGQTGVGFSGGPGGSGFHLLLPARVREPT